MKRMLFAAIAAFGLMSSLYLVSCGEEEPVVVDPCIGKDFGVHGKCVDGKAVCNAGYEVDPGNGRCDLISREKFKGTFTVFDTCSTTKTSTYNISTTEGTTITDLNISGFWKATFANVVKATVAGNKITIVRQEPDKDKFFVEGTGTITNKTIIWKYVVSDETLPVIVRDDCKSKWVKQ